MLAQRAQTFGGIGVFREERGDFADALGDPVFEQREENVFLAAEVGVKSAARVARESGDVFQARGFESVAREGFFRGDEQTAAGRQRAGLLP